MRNYVCIIIFTSKDTQVPYPWTRPTCDGERSLIGKRVTPEQCHGNDEALIKGIHRNDCENQPVKKRRTDTEKWLDAFCGHAELAPQLHQFRNDAEKQVPGRISFRLPQIGAVAGKALDHAIKVMEKMFETLSPVIFKVGWTSSPVLRWTNPRYGYGVSRDKWFGVIILYYSLEPCEPAMMETALIEKFQSAWNACYGCIIFHCYITSFSLKYVSFVGPQKK